MIHHVDKVLEQYLRREVPLSERVADVSFQPPDKTWGAGLNRPTVNAFMWDVTRAQNFASGGMQHRISPDTGGIERRPSTPIVALHYLVTAWATELRDEHQLLGAVLECILAHSTIPDDLLPADMAPGKWRVALATDDRRLPNEFWSSLGGTLKPGLQLQIVLPVEVFGWKATAPLPDSISVDASDMTSPARPVSQEQADPPVELTRRRVNGAMVTEAKGPRPGDQGRGRA